MAIPGRPRKHFIKDRKVELLVGFALFIVASILLWDAFNGRGKNAPFGLGAVLPF